MVVWFVDRQNECHDTVTSVVCAQCVFDCYACIICLSAEGVVRSFTHTMVDGFECRFIDDKLHSVEVLCHVKSGVVSVSSGCVVFFFSSAPFIVPDIWQLACADRNGGVNQRVYGELENRCAVTSFRRGVEMSVCSADAVLCSEEHDRLSLQDIDFLNMVVRFVDRQDECHDTVTSVVCH